MMMDEMEELTLGTSTTDQQDESEPQAITLPVQHTTGWVDHAVLSIATACNLCDVYVHEQVRFEWDTAEKDRRVTQDSFDDGDDIEKKVQIEVYKKFLFDESSIRIEDEDADDFLEERHSAGTPTERKGA
ncbi:expressed unknown protein [Seminavis robusta]|uniref:Uncharacterized protein n=1 Tax=Seminavis robusta TaxID=568900 RepID=A0A9N8EL61_9STRA|nr:expressed unknown protein [Seminavis robusta]|eukprot:Sro1162_g247890.1 n/a (130) ;mRNA; r:16099-16488